MTGPLAPFANYFSVNKKLCAVYNNTIYSYTNTARFVRTNVFVDHYWHIQWKYTNYVYVVIFIFIMLLIIRECQFSGRMYALSCLYADGSRRRRLWWL